jgi:hypothetical protein
MIRPIIVTVRQRLPDGYSQLMQYSVHDAAFIPRRGDYFACDKVGAKENEWKVSEVHHIVITPIGIDPYITYVIYIDKAEKVL